MSAWAETRSRREAEAAAANLEGLRSTLAETEAELEDVRGRVGQVRAARDEIARRMIELNEGADASAHYFNSSYELIPSTSGPQAEFNRLFKQRLRLDEQEHALASRQGGLEHRRDRIRRAIRVEEPRVEGLETALRALDASEGFQRTNSNAETRTDSPAERAPVGTIDPEAEPAGAAAVAVSVPEPTTAQPPASGSISDRLAAIGRRVAGW